MPTRLFIERKSFSSGGMYCVRLDDGSELLHRTRLPAFDSARALLARGVTGIAEMWRNGKSAPDLVFDIETAADLTVTENTVRGPAFGKYKPFDGVSDPLAEELVAAE